MTRDSGVVTGEALAAYNAARHVALGLPIQAEETAGEQRAVRALRHHLGVGPSGAAYQARRCLLYRRESLLHELLTLELAAPAIAELVSSITVVGEGNLHRLPRDRGVILTSLHYGPYASLLIWWLGRAVVDGSLRRLTVLLRTTDGGQYLLSPSRRAEYVAAGVWDDRVQLLDRDTVSRVGSIRGIARRLASREAVLIFPDAAVRPGRDPRGLSVSVGQHPMTFPRGAAWLAAETGATILPIHVRPHGESSFAVVLGEPMYADSRAEQLSLMTRGLQTLVDETVMVDPGPWEVWMREGVVPTAPDVAVRPSCAASVVGDQPGERHRRQGP